MTNGGADLVTDLIVNVFVELGAYDVSMVEFS